MRILILPKFVRQYKKLPQAIKTAAIKQENIFRKDPFDARLHTHKLKSALDGFWAFSVTYSYRVIFDFADEKTIRFYAIGNHDIYDV